MKRLGQKGFGAGEAIVIVVVVVALVGMGWFVWSKQKDKDKPATSSETSGQSPSTNEQKKTASLPPNYTSYVDNSNGFTLAYPQGWGKLNSPDDPSLSGYTKVTPEIDNLTIGLAGLQGRFGYTVASKADFRITPKKYGPTVRYATQEGLPVWRVTEVAPGASGYKVGDSYPIKSSENANGVTIYEFHWTDEGATHARWVFETDAKFVAVELPAILRPEMAPVEESELKTYNEIAFNIRDSIKRTK